MEIIRPEVEKKGKKEDQLIVGIAQIASIWFKRDETLAKVARSITLASKKGCELLVFGEALVPGYPFWIERTDRKSVV